MKRKYNYALSEREGSSQITKRNFIVAHSTATPNGEAWAVARNLKRGINTSQTYIHLVIDYKNIYQVGELGYVAWGHGCRPIAWHSRANLQITSVQ